MSISSTCLIAAPVPVITDLLGGRITMFFGAISPSIPLVREGKVRALAVTSAKRFGAAPELPTMIEAGYPGLSCRSSRSA